MSDPLTRRVLVRLRRPLTSDELGALCRDVAEQVRMGGARRVHCDAGRLSDGDRAVVELVARLALVARRHGAELVVLDPPPDLRDVLDLFGLSDQMSLQQFRGRDAVATRTPGRASRYRGRS